MLTNEEKLELIAGKSFWSFGLEGHEEAPVVKVSDGPAGLRLQYKDEGADSRAGAKPAVCYPSAAACAASFDKDLMKKVGRALGLDCRKNDVAVLLGPALNIKRNPLCGRNFEYFSEDPVLSGEMAASYVNGVQSTGTGACLKHFAANSQETRRFCSDSVIDPGTLFDIYLKAFEIAVKKADPAMVMLAYNKLNGVYCCENEWLIRDVLRAEFGFQGACVSDWGAVNRLCASFNAGMDLRMPGGTEKDEEYLKESFESGKLTQEALDRASDKLVKLIENHKKAVRKPFRYDRGANIRTAGKMAAASVVLLKNEGMMPLSGRRSVLVVGEMAKFPKYRGGGSGFVKLSHAVTPWSALKKEYEDISYCRGYDIFGNGAASGALINEAAEAAKNAESVLIFVGLPETFETEGLDRNSLELPYRQDELIERLAEVNDEITVVVQAGSAVLMPWADKVKSIFMCYPLGSCAGDAIAGVIKGRLNPSGSLPETFVRREQDPAVFGSYPAQGEKAVYSEGKYVGYRFFDVNDKEVLFPFGHGLSYTAFEYDGFEAEIAENELRLSLNVTNTGKRKGARTVQFYLSHESEEKYKELIAFVKTELNAGRTKTVSAAVPLEMLSDFRVSDQARVVRSGRYRVFAAASAGDIRCQTEVILENEIAKPLAAPVPKPVCSEKRTGFDRNTTLSELEQKKIFRPAADLIKAVLSKRNFRFMKGGDLYKLVRDTPVRMLPMGTNGKITAAQIAKAAKTAGSVRKALRMNAVPPGAENEET